MFNPSSDEDVKKFYEYAVNDRANQFYHSGLYSNAVLRHETRRDAYYMRPNAAVPKWRSKIVFATYFLGVRTLMAQISKSFSSNPFVNIKLRQGSKRTPDAEEKRALATYDLNYDLVASRWFEVFNKMQFYLCTTGWCAAREYFVNDSETKSYRKIQTDNYGMNQVVKTQEQVHKEHTKTNLIHPLNFAHDPLVQDIRDSRWSSVRFLISHADIYNMLGNENYYQPGVEELLKKLEKGGAENVISNKMDFYFDDYHSIGNMKNNQLVAYEYSGDANYKGNYDDNDLYYQLTIPKYNVTLRVGKSPFGFKNHWKISAYPDPQSPYAIGGCDPLLPIKTFRDDFINQYVDYIHASTKIMYEVYDGNIMGGLSALIDGAPHGFVVADTPEAFNAGSLVRPVKKDSNGIPGVADMINFMDKYEAQSTPYSNLRGTGTSDQINKTATGIGFQASREDAYVAAMRENIDFGVRDCMYQKLENRLNFTIREVEGEIEGEPIRYAPYELGGPDFEPEVDKMPPDAMAGRIFQALNMAKGFLEIGIIDQNKMAEVLNKGFAASGIDGLEGLAKELPPQINTVPPQMGGTETDMNSQPPQPTIQGVGVNGALAAA